ncbi:MAG: hypothetical protein CfP315_0537 [Candidatus Improbicoccus pseudotrichonymphae]|uniref:Uncharacterized protein n=1 Tax=Candidatus Improbicoccus pseudotrichonymphae TaxID=3033792 RepID=A0AA48KX33_9FIRM|nr:MAG: hypothetical protein CfP315_0537 [Candidatus Improbicoccus pseudotrichonymphae]
MYVRSFYIKCVFFLFFTILFLYPKELKKLIFNINNKINSLKMNEGFPVTFDVELSNEKNFGLMGREIVILNSISLVVINRYSRIIFNEKHGLKNPLMKINKPYILIFDDGGFNFSIKTRNKIFDSKLENEIINANVSSCGCYGFLTQSKEHTSEMIIFDGNNHQKYKYEFENAYAIDISLNKNGNEVAVYAIEYSQDKKKLKSKISIFDLKSEALKYEIELENNLINKIEYFDNSEYLVAVGNNTCIFLDSGKKSYKVFSYNEHELILKYINKKEGLLLTFSPTSNNRNQIIMLFNKKGKIISKINTDKNFKSISFKDGIIAGISENLCYVYGKYGNLITRKKIFESSKFIELTSKTSAYILNMALLDVVYLN